MTNIEIPLFKSRNGKRTAKYRFFEILPGFVSIGAIVLLVVLSLFSPLAASVYVLFIVLLMSVNYI